MKTQLKKVLSLMLAVLTLVCIIPMHNDAKAASTNPFVDVKKGSYYYDAVLWAVEKGITNGTDKTHFSPDDTCTRAQVVTFLWRYARSPMPKSTSNPFNDVQKGSYYYDAVLWAVENGITNGNGTGNKFDPDGKCTRAQVLTFLCRYAKQETTLSKNLHLNGYKFKDIDYGSWYKDAVLWALEMGISNGTDSTHFSPNKDCTRAEVVTFLYRYYNQIGKAVYVNDISALTSKAKAIYDSIRAKNFKACPITKSNTNYCVFSSNPKIFVKASLLLGEEEKIIKYPLDATVSEVVQTKYAKKIADTYDQYFIGLKPRKSTVHHNSSTFTSGWTDLLVAQVQHAYDTAYFKADIIGSSSLRIAKDVTGKPYGYMYEYKAEDYWLSMVPQYNVSVNTAMTSNFFQVVDGQQIPHYISSLSFKTNVATKNNGFFDAMDLMLGAYDLVTSDGAYKVALATYEILKNLSNYWKQDDWKPHSVGQTTEYAASFHTSEKNNRKIYPTVTNQQSPVVLSKVGDWVWLSFVFTGDNAARNILKIKYTSNCKINARG